MARNDQVVHGKKVQWTLDKASRGTEDAHGVEDLNSVADTVRRAMIADKVDVVRRAWDDGRPGEDSCDGNDGGRRRVDEKFGIASALEEGKRCEKEGGEEDISY